MTSEYPILWSFRRCPYAMRARATLYCCSVTVEVREILLKDKPDEFRAASQKATVPVLVLPSGKVIDESQDIMFWALRESGDPCGWLSEYTKNKSKWEGFLDTLQGPFKTALDKYKYSTRYAQDSEDALELASANRDKGAEFLSSLNQMLSRTAFLAGNNFGLADAASLPFVRQFRIADPKWFDAQDWEYLHLWLHTFLNSELFDAIMQKYPAWQPDRPAIIWNG